MSAKLILHRVRGVSRRAAWPWVRITRIAALMYLAYVVVNVLLVLGGMPREVFHEWWSDAILTTIFAVFAYSAGRFHQTHAMGVVRVELVKPDADHVP